MPHSADPSRRFWWLLGFWAALLACDVDPGPGRAGPEQPETRVVSLSPQASDLLGALGATHLLVGVDAASNRLQGLGALPIVDLASAGELAPDLVLVERLAAADASVREAQLSGEAEWVVFDPHDLEELLALSRELGERLVGVAATRIFERELTRPLARIAGASFGQPRLRVVAVTGLDPVELAGGHSFETDPVEIAGGTSVTHGGEESRLGLPENGWSALAPDLILVFGRQELGSAQRRAARERLPKGYPVAFFVFDGGRFWLHDAEATALKLRSVLLRTSSQGP